MSLTDELKSAVRALERAGNEVEKLAQDPLRMNERVLTPVISAKAARLARILISNIRHRARALDDAVDELSGHDG